MDKKTLDALREIASDSKYNIYKDGTRKVSAARLVQLLDYIEELKQPKICECCKDVGCAGCK